jgi:D-glycero-alpha-D-manno-heptose-7-phosphate kinase
MADVLASRSRDARSDRCGVDVTAPVRADLAGGTLDLWPLYCFHPGSVTVNVALRRGVRLRLRLGGVPDGVIEFRAPSHAPEVLRPPDAGRHLVAAVGFHFAPAGGLTVEVLEQPPVGSGLGASSVLAVALARGCLGLTRTTLPSARLVAVLRDLEARVLATPTGVQDYVPALHGGALAIHLEPGGERVERLAVDLEWIGDRMLVVYSGRSHSSGETNWQVYRARVDGDRRVAAAMTAVAGAARACREALLERDEVGVGKAVAAEWEARRELAPVVSTPELEAIIAAGVRAGAYAAKACGAGGGGSVLFWLSPARRRQVFAAALAAASPGAVEVGGGVGRRGARVRWDTQPRREASPRRTR